MARNKIRINMTLGIYRRRGVRNFADFPFADRTFADGHLLIRHLLTGPGHLLTQTFADFSHPCHLLTLEGRLLIQTFADPDNCWFCHNTHFCVYYCCLPFQCTKGHVCTFKLRNLPTFSKKLPQNCRILSKLKGNFQKTQRSSKSTTI